MLNRHVLPNHGFAFADFCKLSAKTLVLVVGRRQIAYFMTVVTTHKDRDHKGVKNSLYGMKHEFDNCFYLNFKNTTRLHTFKYRCELLLLTSWSMIQKRHPQLL